jgi:hypothetical protein
MSVHAQLERIRDRFLALAKSPPYRVVDSIPAAVEAYQRQQVDFEGCSEAEIAELERRFDLKFPAAFRAFLEVMGKRHGALFADSQCSLAEFDDIARRAEDLLDETDDQVRLPSRSFVFLLRDNYQFCFLSTRGGADDPAVFQYTEGDHETEQIAPSFTAFLEQETSAAEEAHRDHHAQGGYELSVQQNPDGSLSTTLRFKPKGR